jgi:hypothetical protein
MEETYDSSILRVFRDISPVCGRDELPYRYREGKSKAK